MNAHPPKIIINQAKRTRGVSSITFMKGRKVRFDPEDEQREQELLPASKGAKTFVLAPLSLRKTPRSHIGENNEGLMWNYTT